MTKTANEAKGGIAGLELSGLYAIADGAYLEAAEFVPAVYAAIKGGARLIQYRDKHRDREERVRIARALADLCRRLQIPLIINDDPQLAVEVGATGVHLGRDDGDADRVRSMLGGMAIIGVSCYNEYERARDAAAAGADYVAFGSIYASPTKPRAVRADLELVRNARRLLNIPVVAIGGITPENGAAVIAAGATALAVSSGVFAQADVRAAAARYARLFEGAS